MDNGNLKVPMLPTVRRVRVAQNAGTVSVGEVEYFVVAVRVINV